MSDKHHVGTHTTVGVVYRAESRRIFATLVRPPGNFDAAEETLRETFRASLQQW